MKKLSAILGAVALSFGFAANANAGADVYVVKFRADWCGPCKVLEPQIDQALSTLNDETVELVNLDISSSQDWDRSIDKSFQKDIVPLFNKYAGLTGFAVIVDAKTRTPVGCINKRHDAYTMASAISSAKHSALNGSGEFACPPAHNKPPS